MLPSTIQAHADALDKLVEEYPDFIPLPVAARFLNMTELGLRAGIEQGTIPFGISWATPKQFKKGRGMNKVVISDADRRGFKIPTLKFYLWYTNSSLAR